MTIDQNPFERWPGYDEQSWQQRYNELDRRYSEMRAQLQSFVVLSALRPSPEGAEAELVERLRDYSNAQDDNAEAALAAWTWDNRRRLLAALQRSGDDTELGEQEKTAAWLRKQAAIYNDQNPDLPELLEWTIAQKWANAVEQGESLFSLITRQASELRALRAGNGYIEAFYELAKMLDIGARASSPREVWEAEMKPRIATALRAGAPVSPPPSGDARDIDILLGIIEQHVSVSDLRPGQREAFERLRNERLEELKSWTIKMAELEGDAEIGVGFESIAALSPVPARGAFRVTCPHCGPLGPMEEHGEGCPRYPSTPVQDEVERLRTKLRMIVSHATSGALSEPKDIDRSTNDICVEISRLRNVLYQAGKDAATPPPVAASEPVAFRYDHPRSDSVFLHEKLRGDTLRGLTGWTETPLYAAPRAALRAGAVRAFLAKWDQAEPHISSAIQIATMHHCPYGGPQLDEEIEALRGVLTPSHGAGE